MLLYFLLVATVSSQLIPPWLQKVPTTKPPRRDPAPLNANVFEKGVTTIHEFSSPHGGMMKFEVILSYGMSDEWILASERAITEYFTGSMTTSGEEANDIGEYLESKFGGFWSVMFVEDPYMIAYTVSKRPVYVLFQVNGEQGVLISSSGVKHNTGNTKFIQGTPFGTGK